MQAQLLQLTEMPLDMDNQSTVIRGPILVASIAIGMLMGTGYSIIVEASLFGWAVACAVTCILYFLPAVWLYSATHSPAHFGFVGVFLDPSATPQAQNAGFKWLIGSVVFSIILCWLAHSIGLQKNLSVAIFVPIMFALTSLRLKYY